MTYDRFEQLPVWQAVVKLGQRVYGLTKHAALRRQHSLHDQIERAAVSVSNNIAEGFERSTTQELLTFFISRAVRRMKCDQCSVCSKAFRNLVISNLKFQI